jgi:hypothetical protein
VALLATLVSRHVWFKEPSRDQRVEYPLAVRQAHLTGVLGTGQWATSLTFAVTGSDSAAPSVPETRWWSPEGLTGPPPTLPHTWTKTEATGAFRFTFHVTNLLLASTWTQASATLRTQAPTVRFTFPSGESPVRCVDFTQRDGWLSSYPPLAAKPAPWGRYFATYLAEALGRVDREAYTARRFDDTNQPPDLRKLELVCLGELLAAEPAPTAAGTNQHLLRLEYELKSTRTVPALVLERREVAVAEGFPGGFDEGSLHQLLRLAADRVADHIKRKLPSVISGTR